VEHLLVEDVRGHWLSSFRSRVLLEQRGFRAPPFRNISVRSQKRLDRLLREIEEAPGIALFTLLEKDLVARLEAKCQEINLPSLSIIGPVMQLFHAYLGAPTTGRLGASNSGDIEHGALVKSIFIKWL